MADDVTYTSGANATPPANVKAATDEITTGVHTGAHAGVAKLAVSADGDGTHLPATATDGLLVNLGTNNDVTVTGSVTVTGGATETTLAAIDTDLGAATDAEATGNGSIIAILKRLRTLLASLGVTGGGAETTAQRVTIASDSTGLLSVDDNGGSLTVDAPVATPVNVQIGDASNTATIRNLAANDALNVAIVDGAGSQVTSFGGTGGTSMTDDAPFTPASTAVTPIAAMADELTPDSVNEGDAGVLRMSLNRNLHTDIRDAAGNERGANVNALNQLAVSVDNTVTVGSHAVTDGGGSLTVDGAVSLAAAIPAGTNNIGDVDVLSVPAPLSTAGGGTEATAQRVTIANDSTGVLSVDDNGGSLTVDAPIGTPANVQIGDGTRTATVRDTGASDSLNVAITDAAGAQITSFGGGTEYVEDAASAANPQGGQLISRRRDVLTAAEVSAEGDVIAVNSTSKGELYVKQTDAVPVTDNGGSLTVDGAVSVSGAVDTELTTADVDTGAGTDTRAVVGLVTAASGGGVLVSATNPLPVTGGGGGTQFNEDAPHTTGDLGSVALGVRQDADSSPVSATGDYQTMLFDQTGNLKVNVKAGSGGGVSHTDDAPFTPGTSATVPAAGVFDDVTPDSVDEGDAGALRMGANRVLYTSIRDRTNERGVNVNSSNQLSVSIDNNPPVKMHQPTGVTTAWTSATAIDGTANVLALDVKTYTSVTFSFTPTGSITAGSISFEVSDDESTTWYPIPGTRSELPKNTEVSFLLNGATKKMWDANVGAVTDFRVILTSAIVGAGTATIRIQASAGPTESFQPVTILDSTGAPQAFAPDHTLASGPMSNRASDGSNFMDRAEDSVAASGDSGYPIVAVRNDAAASKTSADGDYSMLATDAAGRLGIADLGGSVTVDAPVGTPANVQIGDGTRTATVRDTGASDSLNVAIVDAAGAHVTSFGGGTQYAEDSAHSSGDQVTLAGVVQQTADAALSGDGDRSVAQVDATGWLKTNVKALPALPAGNNNIGDVDVASGPTGASSLQSQGTAATDAAVAGNPLLTGGRASTAFPSAVSADGDAVPLWMNRYGSPIVSMAPHAGILNDPWSLQHEAAQYTTAQGSPGTVLVAGGASEKIVVTKVQIQAFGTTAFDIQLYFGTGAFARGTNRACFDGTFKPTAALAPGAILDGPFISGANGDDLLVMTSAAGSVTVNVWYYIVT
jgi:hypothetical protein